MRQRKFPALCDREQFYPVLEVCRHVINYSNRRDYGISNLKLQKILYFIQAFFLMTDSVPCFPERIEAWEIGPIVPKAYFEYKQYGSGDIPTISHWLYIDQDNVWDSKRVSYHDNVIKGRKMQLIHQVVDRFSDYNATDLVTLTHNQSPWINAYHMQEGSEITVGALRDYFCG